MVLDRTKRRMDEIIDLGSEWGEVCWVGLDLRVVLMSMREMKVNRRKEMGRIYVFIINDYIYIHNLHLQTLTSLFPFYNRINIFYFHLQSHNHFISVSSSSSSTISIILYSILSNSSNSYFNFTTSWINDGSFNTFNIN